MQRNCGIINETTIIQTFNAINTTYLSYLSQINSFLNAFKIQCAKGCYSRQLQTLNCSCSSITEVSYYYGNISLIRTLVNDVFGYTGKGNVTVLNQFINQTDTILYEYQQLYDLLITNPPNITAIDSLLATIVKEITVITANWTTWIATGAH